ncbi:hypothetical protein Dimus_007022 [Dionaea muscipula]
MASMEIVNRLLTLLMINVVVVLSFVLVDGCSDHGDDYHHHLKLFVFGDSYADTGNNARTISESWKSPYGISWPGKPAGRWSDGFVFTDYIAKYMRMRSPVTFRSWKNHGPEKLKYGVSFAYGGTGVFDTDAPYPNMTAQINLLRRLVKQGVYNSHDLRNSVALVSLVGNDYAYYVANHGFDVGGVLQFQDKLIAQLVHNVKRIRGMGVKQVMVTGLPPLGCLPRFTKSRNYTCNDEFNLLVDFHNGDLNETIGNMNVNETLKHHGMDYTPYIYVDLSAPFLSLLNGTVPPSGKPALEKPFEACCMGVTEDYYCASVEKNGTKMYTLCDDAGAKLFWDRSHPTQRGWSEVMYLIQDDLSKLQIPRKN